MSRDEWSCGAQASAVDPCTIVHLRRELRSSLNSAECIGERSRVVADHYRSSCRRRKGSVGRDGVRRIEAADSRRSGPPASLNASFNSTRPCKKLPSVSCGLRFFSRNRICFPLSIIERVALWDVWQCNLAMKWAWKVGRTADLTQVRSTPPTCKRTPHCKDGKHGGGYGGMVSHKCGKVISAHGPEPASACSADSEAKRIY
ncbi:hypothetical protein GW17_00060079 [Ensete ventricosum]|nr:hypothetical protein GW17_00060079 [Ensete ventricosum]